MLNRVNRRVNAINPAALFLTVFFQNFQDYISALRE